MEYTVYKYGQVTKFEAGVVYRAYKEGTIKCLPEFTSLLYDLTKEDIRYAYVRAQRDYDTYNTIYNIVRNILNNNFKKANELIAKFEEDSIVNGGKKSRFYKYKKEYLKKMEEENE